MNSTANVIEFSSDEDSDKDLDELNSTLTPVANTRSTPELTSPERNALRVLQQIDSSVSKNVIIEAIRKKNETEKTMLKYVKMLARN